MLNAEKYKDEIIQVEGSFGLFKLNRVVSCDKMRCDYCGFYNDNLNECSSERVLWLLKEYEEPKVDWSKVSVDTKILDFYVENNWVQRHFAKYENGIVYAWNFGRTSWSAEDKYDYYPVKNAKLEEEE